MVVVFQVIATYAPYIYLVCGLTALYQLYRLWQVREERRQAIFMLERERAVRELSGIFSVALLLLVIMGFTYFASRTIPQAIVAEPEPTLPPQFALAITPTNTPLPVTPSPTPTETATPTPEPPTPEPGQQTIEQPPTPTPEPAPAAQAGSPPLCPDARSVISSPGNGATVSGVFTLIGTATHEQFSYYKVEFAPGANAQNGFTYLADGRGPVFNGALASINSRGFANGPWTFQLTVVDLTGNYPEPCRVTLYIEN
ncbi:MULTISPECIES: hypothetical protein [Caldilinea]|jgi:hypothetical protein|uniref:Uncharacterized protein n=1 Tax=Caldilinea aerophila (strain DSM 14535 / JCM 11387 / NBRC 104270 / STL-6-O1) TaxID=926550 RepID=I0I6W1_CALAS|nr:MULTISPECIES: hypothetical protein [Caldilinea]MBO9393986.1 hypothetical protein [Caldilinea sp.]BAM00999.1 hypothetical protein CLDAP_29590 [Caldilinea aerophila DSM 14535 = NBRC 104270]GIV72337.1 MAG: hypothetical protein KatS3mg049_0893 [Caldilinea sp.]